jgi:OmcA/MtrC family decaheme c-type cytochrome
MTRSKSLDLWCSCRALVYATLMLALTGCGGGSSGSPGLAGPPGPGGPPGNAPPHVTALSITITGVSIVGGHPVVDFQVKGTGDLGGVVAFPGLNPVDNPQIFDLRFNIAKLIPPNFGEPSTWQNYIVRVSGGAMQGSQERNRSGYPFNLNGLVDHGDGTYTYTFATDLTTVSTTCLPPCRTADNKPLDLAYVPTLVTRVGIQQASSTIPPANAVYDFIPSNGPGPVASSGREIVKTANCNVCHDKLIGHGTRIETRLCVTCHNPGSWVAKDVANGTLADTTVDFRVMIHRIHRGEDLPTGGFVLDAGHDFSDVAFPQDNRNCTKCHDGDVNSPQYTLQGDNWEMVPSMEACGSCHDDIDFSKDGSGNPPIDPNGHPGGIVTSNGVCLNCHSTGNWAGSIADSHAIPGKAERAFFKFNILKICGTDVGSDPQCPANTPVTVTFSVTDPAGTTSHDYDNLGNGNAYNINPLTTTDPEFKSGNARIRLDIAWQTSDYTNYGGTGSRPAQAANITLIQASNNTFNAALTDNMDGTYTFLGNLNAPPQVVPNPAVDDQGNPLGSGAVALEGRADPDGSGAVRVRVDSEVAYYAINDNTPKPRRVVVAATTKCDNCHDVLSAHGDSRNNNVQLCVMCHNSSDTDVGHHGVTTSNVLPPISSLDGKTEESIDFKRMIHGIHAGSSSAGGMRDKGLVVASGDFSDVRFPGVLSRCETCHIKDSKGHDTYTLEDRSGVDNGGNWVYPYQNGIRGSTVNSYTDALVDADLNNALIDQTDDLKFSPIASVCSSCHDGALEQSHMEDNGGLFGVFDTATGRIVEDPLVGLPYNQAFQGTYSHIESCPLCHGPGQIYDVKAKHDEATAKTLREYFP